jgi:hypothetical protein
MRVAVLFIVVALTLAGQTCRPSQVSVRTQCCDGAAGSLYAQILIANRSARKCELQGVPKARLFDESGKTVSASVQGGVDLDKHGAGADRIVLAPGKTAAMTVVTGEPDSDDSRCGTRMRIDIDGVIVNLKMPACGPKNGTLRVFFSGFHPHEHHDSSPAVQP